jgi:serine/threonine-protein kinase
VIHRDIKPENILLHDGRAIVADFGIALAVTSAGSSRMTETGMSLGTPNYMSPEQAMGERELAPTSDIYSLGAVLYELLVGEPPFSGPTAQAIVARVVTESPRPLVPQRHTVPRHVEAATIKALEKLPADRFASAAEFSAALVDQGFASQVQEVSAATRVETLGKWNRMTIGLAAVAVAAIVVAAVGWMRGGSSAPSVTRLDLDLADVTVRNTWRNDVTISPDGSMLAVAGERDGDGGIFLRRLGEADFHMVPGTEGGDTPSFSPDGNWMVYRDHGADRLVKMAVSGGGAITLVQSDSINPFWPHWGEDGTVAFGAREGLFIVPAAGGPTRKLRPGPTTLPHVLPDGSGVLFSSFNEDGVQLYDLKADSARTLIPDGRHAVYVATGHILYQPASGGLFAVPFDLGRGEVTGPPIRVLDRVAARVARAGYAVSRGGSLVHHEGNAAAAAGLTLLAVLHLDGRIDTLPLPPGLRFDPSFSPDGRTIAYEQRRDVGDNSATDIHTFDLVTGTASQITFEGDNDNPVWSPDGTRIMFDRDDEDGDEDIWVKPADNSSAAELVLDRPGNQAPDAWLASDRLVFSTREASNWDLFIHSLSGDGDPQPYLQAPWNETRIAVSPDETLAAFMSDETGEREVWLRDFPVPSGKWLVSHGGGVFPRWAPDGASLYFWRTGPGADSLFAVSVEREPTVVVGQAQLVLTASVSNRTTWDVHPDGDRFLVVQPGQTENQDQDDERYLVVLNWFEELRERVGE